jgi:hypothetical protein
MVKVALVIPTIRKFKEWDSFKQAIECSDFKVDIYTCGEEKDVNPHIDKVIYSSPKWRVKEFGKKNLWMFPPFTRHVNSIYAYILKHNLRYDMIVTIDDDLECDAGFFMQHWQALNQPVWDNFENVLQTGFPRGFPYKHRNKGNSFVLFNQGLWDNIPDLNAHDYASMPFHNPKLGFNIAPIGKGITVSSMNVAFTPEILRVYYQPVNWTRHDDIWSGLIVKRILDACGWYIGYGDPIVRHNKFPRNIWEDNKKEANGHEINEQMWDELQKIKLEGSIWDMYKTIANKLPFTEVTKYMKGWINLMESFK